MQNNSNKGLKLMLVDVAFFAFDFVLLFLWWKFVTWFFENQLIITILITASLFGLMSQAWGFFARLSEHWKLHKLEQSSKSTDLK